MKNITLTRSVQNRIALVGKTHNGRYAVIRLGERDNAQKILQALLNNVTKGKLPTMTSAIPYADRRGLNFAIYNIDAQ